MKLKSTLRVDYQLLASTIDQLPVGAFIMTTALGGGVAVSNRKMRDLWGTPKGESVDEYKAGNYETAALRL